MQVTTTRALITRGDGSSPIMIEVELDPLGDREVLVEIAAAAVCSTELMTIDRRIADPTAGATPPTVLGHAATGTVTSVGAAVERVRPGDRVVIVGTRQCGRCWYCRHGAPGACDEIFEFMQRRVGVSAGEVVFSDGGMGTHAERMHFPESNVVRIEGLVPDEHLAMLGCGITSGAGAVIDVAEVAPGESVAVLGCGHLGLWMVQAARAAGADVVIAIDPDATRREIALELGATHALAPGVDLLDRVRDLTDGRGVDVALEAAGSVDAIEQAFTISRYGARVVPTGLESETAVVRLNNLQLSLGSRTVIGAQCGGGDVLRLVPELERALASGALDGTRILTAVRPLEAAAETYAAMVDPAQFTGVITMESSTSSSSPTTQPSPRSHP
jgi:Zn-dependent alcohol dehydrogenase